MPSSIRDNLNREFRIRGGVTLGLGPLMAKTYGSSDLRKELSRRLKEGSEAGRMQTISEVLLLSISVGGALTKRELCKVAQHAEVAELIVRSSLEREPTGAMLKQIADEDNCSEALRELNETVASGQWWPSCRTTLYVKPRPTTSDAGKKMHVGRNEPCPCGSGKKFKKCHMGSEEHVGSTDAPGTPGLTPAEVFWFRDFTEELGRLCHARLTASGPRAGETLFWPIELAPADEIEIRIAMAVASGEGLADVLDRGLALNYFESTDVASVVLRAFPPAGWFTGELFNWLKDLPEERAEELSLFGAWSGQDVLALRKARAADLNELVGALADTGRALDDACALAVAGHDRLAYVALQMARGSGEPLDDSAINLFEELERGLAPRFGRKVVGISRGVLAVKSPNLPDLGSLQKRILDLKREVDRERDLRQQIQAAWSNDERTSGEDSLRAELRRLRGELKVERQTARDALKDVQRFRQRERVRLIQESHLEADVVAALVHERASDEPEEDAIHEIVYSDEFEGAVNRIPKSTLARLRDQIATFAKGGRVREAKRMEAIDGVWTLRAGLNYRVLLKRTAHRIDVLSLIPREDLENTLTRLRR